MLVKLDENNNIVNTDDTKVLKHNNLVVINPKANDFIEAGYLPLLNNEEQPEFREGYYSIEKYKNNEDNTGVLKYFEYIKIEEPNEQTTIL